MGIKQMKTGFGFFRDYAKGASSMGKAMIGSVLSPKKTMTNIKKLHGTLGSISGATKAKGMNKLARQSAAYLGTGAGLTYVARTTRKGNRDPFKNNKGNRDILPWVPFV